MTTEQTAKLSRPGLWGLTANSPDSAIEIRWPDDDGPWLITVYWGQVNGRPAMVGMDIRSRGDQREVTQAVLRGISITKVRDVTRMALIQRYEALALAPYSVPLNSTEEPLAYRSPEVAALAEPAMDRLATLTAKGEPRKRRPAASEDMLRLVAALYMEAVGSGSKAPAKYVEDQLREAGEPRLSTQGGRVLVRQWIRRARERGYLPPNGGTK